MERERLEYVEKIAPNKRLQPTAFGVGMRGAFCQLSFWLLERILPESAAAEPQAVSPLLRQWHETIRHLQENVCVSQST